SLRAAGLISLLRDESATAALAVRDLYEVRTVAGLAGRAAHTREPAVREPRPVRPRVHPLAATIVQTTWLLLGLVLAGPIVYLLAAEAVPDLTRSLGLVPFLLLSPLFYLGGMAAYAVAAVAFAVMAKRLLIGRYCPCRAPVWGSFYVRNWMV